MPAVVEKLLDAAEVCLSRQMKCWAMQTGGFASKQNDRKLFWPLNHCMEELKRNVLQQWALHEVQAWMFDNSRKYTTIFLVDLVFRMLGGLCLNPGSVYKEHGVHVWPPCVKGIAEA